MTCLWTAIDSKYGPGNNEVSQNLVEACRKCGVESFEDLFNPEQVTAAKLAAAGASTQAIHLATALVLLKGVSYDHLLRPAA